MSLYQGIAQVYDHVFPLKPERLELVLSLCPEGGRHLDIGCATGSLVLAVSRAGRDAGGVDLDSEMIRLARERAATTGSAARFEVLDMLEAATRFRGQRFDTVTCLGNVVVHLGSRERIGAFLAGLGTLLAPGGRAAIQHVRYEGLIAGSAKPMPVIENEHIRFVRASSYDAAAHAVRFRTELTVKATGETRRDETELYPLTSVELSALAAEAGLTLQAAYADFSRRPAVAGDGSQIALLS